MSGSYYALDSKYNSLLAQLADIQGDAAPQGLASVLDVSDDAANVNMTNVNTITVNTINYTTLNPAIPEVIGNINQVLAVGNDAANQSIVNLGSVNMKNGGGGSITFADGTTQSTAFTGVAATPNLSAVLAEGSNANASVITNLQGISTGGANPLSLASFNQQDINLVAYPSGVADSGSVVISTAPVGGSQQAWSFNGDNSVDLPTNSSLDFGGGSTIKEDGDLEIEGGSGNVVVVGDLQLQAGGGGSLFFQDGTEQTTAFTGAVVPPLNSVLGAGNDAGGQSITGLNDVGLTTINGSAYPPVVPADTISAVLSAGSVASSQPITGLSNVGTTQITFGDATIQTTAFTGVGATPNLASVLGVGADGANIPMTSLGNMSATNWTLGGFGGGSPDSYLTNEQEGGTLFINTTSFGGSTIQSLAIDSGTNGAAFGVDIDMNNNQILDVNSINSSSDDVVFTDGSENATGSGLTLLGTNMGTASGNNGVAVGISAFSGGVLATNSVVVGSGAAYQGSGVGSVSVGYNAGGGSSSTTAQGDGAVAIGNQSGAGVGSQQGVASVAIGSGAGGYGQNANCVAVGVNSGKGTLSTAPQGANSICIGANAGLGYGSGGVPANSLTISSMRTSTTASNFLTYNNITKEVSNIAGLTITANTFAIGNNTGVGAGVNTYAAGINTGNSAAYTSFAAGINTGNNTTGNQTSIGESSGNNSGQSVCIGINTGIGTFNAVCIGNGAGSIGLGDNSVAIGTNASSTNGAADSICIVGDATTVNPPNSGLFISPIRGVALGLGVGVMKYDPVSKEVVYSTN